MAVSQNSAEAIAHEPDRIIRNLIGVNTRLEEIFTQERIAASQKVLDDARGSFFSHARGDLVRLEELATKNTAAPDKCEPVFEEMISAAANLRGHAEIFGYGLVAAICGHIADLATPNGHSAAARIQLTGDLIRMLGIAIREKVTDDTGAVGRELKVSLGSLRSRK